MTERLIVQCVVEYVFNCAWQIPLLAAGAWVLVKIVKPGIVAQHGLWLSVLAMAVLLPLRGAVLLHLRGGELRSVQIGALVAAPSLAHRIQTVNTRSIDPVSLRGETTTPAWAPPFRQKVPWRHQGFHVVLSAVAMRLLAAVYVFSIFAGAVRLARGLLATRRLVRSSREVALAPRTMRLLVESCRRLKVAMPLVRESSKSDGPAIVGALSPVLLLPKRFEEHAEGEMSAALLHELAHVRRRDYLVNLICQTAALPVVWHPVVYAVQQRIRRTREMACDATAASEMQSGTEYAYCLVSFARRMLRDAGGSHRTEAMGLFEKNTMEERVMKLTETRVSPGARTKAVRLMCGAAAMMVVTATALTLDVGPTFAAVEANVQNAPAFLAAPVQPKPSAQVRVTDQGTLAIARGDHANLAIGKGDYVHRWKSASGEPFALVNRNPKEPTAEEQSAVERQLSGSHMEIDEAKRWIDDPDLKLQMEELQRRLDGVEMKRQLETANRLANDPTFKLRMEELQKQLDTLPELKKFNDPEWQKRFTELQNVPPQFNFDFDLDNQRVFANSAMSEGKLKAFLADGGKGHDEQMAKLQKQMESDELKRKLEEATRLLQDVKKRMDTLQWK